MKKKQKNKKLKPESLMMTAGYNPGWSDWAATCPMIPTSTFVFPTAEDGEYAFAVGYGLRKPQKGRVAVDIYRRLNFPGQEIAEDRLTLLEKGAKAAALLSSGMAAITTVLNNDEFLPAGDILVVTSPLYGGTDHFLTKMLVKRGVKVIFISAKQSKKEIVALLEKENAKGRLGMIFCETPANPTNDIFNIKMLRKIANKFSTAEKKTILAVDNTYLGPMWQSPIKFGADLVIYSVTKYLGGHSDILAGAVLGSKELITKIKVARTFLGNMSDPFTCWLLLRSLETLKVRTDKQAKSAAKIAKKLANNPLLEKVAFIGNLTEKDGKKYKVKKRQCKSNGAMIAFYVPGGKKQAFKFLNSLKLVKLAVSLGSTGSLAQHPFSMTHADVDVEVKNRLGITESLIRLSVGVENWHDVLADIMQALKKAAQK